MLWGAGQLLKTYYPQLITIQTEVRLYPMTGRSAAPPAGADAVPKSPATGNKGPPSRKSP